MVQASTMKSRGFTGPGKAGSAQEAAWKRAHLVKAQAVPVVKTLWVHRSSVEAFNALNLILQQHGEGLGRVADDWGFSNRFIRGVPGEDSYHKYAKAEDIDATENPQHRLRTTFPVKITHQAIALLKLVWGFDWSVKWADPMHFQDELTYKQRRRIAWLITHPSPRRHKLAKLAKLKPREFTRRIKKFEAYGS